MALKRQPKADGPTAASAKAKQGRGKRALGSSGDPNVPASLRIDLDAPGMSALLRAGVGGLAAAIRAVALERDRNARWPVPAEFGKGSATVHRRHVELDFQGDAEALLKALFSAAFRIRAPEGFVEMAGTFDPLRPLAPDVAAQIQAGLLRTFLQHGKHRELVKGETQPLAYEIDDRTTYVRAPICRSYVHQSAAAKVLAAFQGPQRLAGWAYTGAGDRHSGLGGATKWEFSPDQVVAGAFAAVGALSLTATGGRGVLVVPEPADLVAFAKLRPRLAPHRAAEGLMASVGDAVLRVQLAVRLEDAKRPCVERVHGVVLAKLPWAKQVMSRRHTLQLDELPGEVLDVYEQLTRRLPSRVVHKNDDAFYVASNLRGFVADNLALGQRWFAGFASTKVGSVSDPKPIHACIHWGEKEGIMELIENLEHAEAALVRAVHAALRQRFGAIADESKDNPHAMKKRWQGERDRWRHAFAGAKTHQQVRAALADLWSRGGRNEELQQHWQDVLPLLRADRWTAARDLALVGLASYRGTGKVADEPDEGELESTDEEDEL